MTIAAGFCCDEGIVLVADTEETVGDTKQWMGKIETIVYPKTGNVVAFAGAGWVDYIKTALEKAPRGLSGCEGLLSIRTTLEANLLAFFKKHLVSWHSFPVNDRPFVELLVAVATRSGSLDLFYYGGTAFYSTRGKAIGSGVVLANDLISQCRSNKETLDELCRIAVFTVSRVKKQVTFCGGDTHVYAVRKGGNWGFMENGQTETLEKELEMATRACEDDLGNKIRLTGNVRMSWLNDTQRKPIISADSST